MIFAFLFLTYFTLCPRLYFIHLTTTEQFRSFLWLLLLSPVSRVRLCDPTDGSPPGSCPWDSPGKNTGVGCHFLLRCMKVKSESEVAQSCPTLCDPVDCSLRGSSVHGIFQARGLEWGAIDFSSTAVTFL